LALFHIFIMICAPAEFPVRQGLVRTGPEWIRIRIGQVESIRAIKNFHARAAAIVAVRTEVDYASYYH